MSNIFTNLPTLHEIRSNRYLLVWNLGAFATLLLPLLIFLVANSTNGYNRGNSGDNGEYQQQSHWWSWGNGGGNNGEGGSGDRRGKPWWFLWGEEREAEEGKGTIVLAYLWGLCLFLFVVYFGNIAIQRNVERDVIGLKMMLFISANFSAICCLLVGSLGIEVEGRELEEHGFYGQFAVCMFLTCLFWVFYGIGFLCWCRQMDFSKGNWQEQLSAPQASTPYSIEPNQSQQHSVWPFSKEQKNASSNMEAGQPSWWFA